LWRRAYTAFVLHRKAFIFTVARNLTLNWLKKNRRLVHFSRLFKDGKQVFMLERTDLQRMNEPQVAEALRKAFDAHCSRTGPSIDAETFNTVKKTLFGTDADAWPSIPEIGPFGEVGASLANVRRLPFPAHTMLAFNVSDQQGASVVNDHTHGERWAGNWTRVCADIQPDRHRAGTPKADHTEGAANYLFADGHVQAIAAAEVKRQIDRGVAFSKPPMEPGDLAAR
jgi:prepilin-type processing-associated H-X9-DG protein